MTTMIHPSPSSPKHGPDKAIILALTLAQAENAIHAFTSGQIDAVLDSDGNTYLMRAAQEQLRQNERLLQAVLDSAADVITVVNRGGAILSQSHAVRRVLGYGPDEMVGERFFDLVHPDDLAAVHAAFFNVIEEFLTEATVEFRHRTRDGSFRMVEATISRLRDVSGASVVLTCRDMTRRRRAEEASAGRESVLTDAAQSKDRFLAMLPHELRTPLAPILLGVQDLQEDERFVEARPTLSMIRRYSDLQSRLIEELFDFTKVGQHKVRLRPESIDAHASVHLVLEICRSEIAAAGISVLLGLHALENIVLADPVRLQQVMWNLVKNAVKFSSPGGSISITSANDGQGMLSLRFADQGIGIDAGLLPHVFDPFKQGDHAIRTGCSGLGLGMFIARGLAEAQQGTLTVASEGHGKGATFILSLKTVAPVAPVADGVA